MSRYTIRCTLLSDTALGSGRGLAGGVDTDVQHDALGLPFIHGRTLKGLLTTSCAEVLAALRHTQPNTYAGFAEAATWLFGAPGSLLAANAALHIGHAELPIDLRDALAYAKLSAQDVLAAFTSIRRQTAIDEKTGATDEHSLRSMRVLTRGLQLDSVVIAQRKLSPLEETVLAACVRVTRNIGLHRSRGLGHVQLSLLNTAGQPIVTNFKNELMGGK